MLLSCEDKYWADFWDLEGKKWLQQNQPCLQEVYFTEITSIKMKSIGLPDQSNPEVQYLYSKRVCYDN